MAVTSCVLLVVHITLSVFHAKLFLSALSRTIRRGRSAASVTTPLVEKNPTLCVFSAPRSGLPPALPCGVYLAHLL